MRIKELVNVTRTHEGFEEMSSLDPYSTSAKCGGTMYRL